MEFSLVKKVLENRPRDLTDAELDVMLTYYLYAAREGRAILFRILREHESEVSKRTDMTYKALLEAAYYGQREFINNITAGRRYGGMLRRDSYKIIESAAKGGHKRTVSFLLNKLAPADEHAEILSQINLPNDWMNIEPVRPTDLITISESQYADITQLNVLPSALSGLSSYGFDAALYNQMLYLCSEYCRIKKAPSRIERRAYNAQVLFGTEEFADKYLSRVSDDKNNHRSFDFDLPVQGEWDILAWRDKVIEHGHTLVSSLKYAPEVERGLLKSYGKCVRQATLDEIKAVTYCIAYEGGDKYPAIARVGLHLNLSQEQFSRSVAILSRAPSEVKTPDIFVNGDDIGCHGFTLERVASDDPLNLWIGGFRNINNCNKIGKIEGARNGQGGNVDGENLAILQSCDEYISLYLVRNRKGTPVAKMTGWLQDDAFVFNSWQSVGNVYNDIRSLFVLAAAEQSMIKNPDTTHDRVLLGVGVKGEKYTEDDALMAGFQKASDPVYLDEEDVCAIDARVQLIVLCRSDLTQVSSRMANLKQARQNFLEQSPFTFPGRKSLELA